MKRKFKRSVKISMSLLLIVLVVGIILFWEMSKPKKITIGTSIKVTIPEIKRVSLIMTGDSLIHDAVYSRARKGNSYDFKPMLRYIKDIVSNYDLAFYNQESILGGSEIGLSNYPRFNSPYEVGDAFLDAGFNMVSLANNHTLDRGSRAINNSLAYWEKQRDKVIYSGSARSWEERNKYNVGEKNKIKYALLSYTTVDNGLKTTKPYEINLFSYDRVKEDIEEIRDKVDYLFVSMHWGVEYSLKENQEQRKIANFLKDNGVDIVIGHHPHVLEPIEQMGNTWVIYSLGNFLSAQVGVEKLTGALVSVDLYSQGKYKYMKNKRAELIYTNRGEYVVYPYDKAPLKGKETYYLKYKNVLTSKDKDIEVKSLGN